MLGKVDMQFCGNVLSFANFLFFLKNSDSSYCNQNMICCQFQTSSLFLLEKLIYPYQEHIDKSGKTTTLFFLTTVKFLLINSIHISYFLRKTMLFIRMRTLGNIFKWKNIVLFESCMSNFKEALKQIQCI